MSRLNIKWDVLERSKDRIEQFRRTIPLISDLRNEAMRTRHWEAIRKEIGRDFDPNDSSFTLEKIMDLGFEHYAVYINELSEAATKEMTIEKSINKIESIWTEIELDIVPFKDKGHFRLRSTDDLFTMLEDHQIQLSAMKASRFVKSFEREVDKWERALSRITETAEMLLTIQRHWLYMETIFMGDDIRQQLPKESSIFDELDVMWKRIMIKMNEVKNAQKCSMIKGISEQLSSMNEKFEMIEKSLDSYLESKRQIFPRFYFISNDDLLQIVGQAKNPEAIIPHLKKCFDNICIVKLEKKTVKKPVVQATKAQVATKSHIRKRASDLVKKSEEIEDPLQQENLSVNKVEWPISDEQQSDLKPGERKETIAIAVPSQEPSRLSSGKLSPGANESNTARRHHSGLAKKSELRARYFGSSNSDNNVSRSGSSISTHTLNNSSTGEIILPFSGGHNAGPMPTGKKGTTQTVSYSQAVHRLLLVIGRKTND
ncbi:unnamed protein product [Rodentolepis nana]|uniref:DHC_N2 domain-containing protein n=1 Tax=Rodentolepis nana TaxID=102285 RepID=A0A0R3TKW5_RODNA|nr:unnamed protein product [Rodentolepis nana]